MTLVKNWHYLQKLYFVFKFPVILVDYFLTRKERFLGYKMSFLQSRKICIFPKCLLHNFDQKFGLFLHVVFLFKRPKYIQLFDYVLNRKQRFLDWKTSFLHSWKIRIFPQGSVNPWVGQKLSFLYFFFQKAKIYCLIYVLARKEHFWD